MKTLFAQHWTEYERGWGSRPDGLSLHNSREDRKTFIDKYNKKYNNAPVAPDDYSVADGEAFMIQVDDDLCTIVSNGMWVTNSWFDENKKEGRIMT